MRSAGDHPMRVSHKAPARGSIVVGRAGVKKLHLTLNKAATLHPWEDGRRKIALKESPEPWLTRLVDSGTLDEPPAENRVTEVTP